MLEVQDNTEMRRLATVYCSAVDDGNAALMASLFVPEGRLVVYEEGVLPGAGTPLRSWHGAEGFAKLLTVLGQNYLRWVHFLGNHWVEADGNGAKGEAYLFACHLREGNEGNQEEEVAIIRYRDFYVRTADGWRFRERNACRQWTTVRPLNSGPHQIDAFLRGGLR